jgi:hypothetical protein
MTTRISIEILHGSASVADEDRARAENAALAVIEAAGTTPELASAEYRRQWIEFDDRDPMTGLALVWIATEQAADVIDHTVG